MNEDMEKILERKIHSRWLIEMLPHMGILAITLILMIFLVPIARLEERYPWIFPTIPLIVIVGLYLIGWIVNLKWVLKDQKKFIQVLNSEYDRRLLKLINITSIFYLFPLFIPIVIIVRGSTRRIIKNKIKPNTLAAFINESYLKGRS